MNYHVSSVDISVIPSDNDNKIWSYCPNSTTHPICTQAGLNNKNLEQQKHPLIHLEIYDNASDLWYVSFELLCRSPTDGSSNFRLHEKKLIVYPSLHEWVYVYCLESKKCINVHRTHNYLLNPPDEDKNMPFGYQNKYYPQWLFLEPNNELLITNGWYIGLFSSHSVEWIEYPCILPCDYRLEYTNKKLRLHDDNKKHELSDIVLELDLNNPIQPKTIY